MTKATDIDIHIGARMRTRREGLGITQAGLAAALDVTFQQVQKYERGTNRVSGSKLFAAAQALGVDPNYFYQGLDGAPGEEQIDFGSIAGAQELGRAFRDLKPKERAVVISLAQQLSGQVQNALA